jgi:hypothetical protein
MKVKKQLAVRRDINVNELGQDILTAWVIVHKKSLKIP